MKKLILALLTICSFFSFAQEKKVKFIKKLDYKLILQKKNKETISQKISFQTYLGKNKEYLTLGNVNGLMINFFTKENNTYLVNIGLNDRLTAFNSSFFGFSSSAEVKEQKYAASKLNTTEIVSGIPCNQFLLKPIFPENDDQEETKNIKVCVNQDYGINNIPLITSLFNSLERQKQIDFNISGLALKLGAEKDYDNEYLILQSITDNKSHAWIDIEKIASENKKAKDSLNKVYKEWDKLSADSTNAKIAPVDASVIEEYNTIPVYKSTYKVEPKRDTISLAINSESNKNLFNGIPKYCLRIDQDLPKFEMKDLDYHVKNYVGQMCDMYLTQAYEHSVAIKITLDEIRRETLFLINIRKRLSEKDLKKLDNYLNNLD